MVDEWLRAGVPVHRAAALSSLHLGSPEPAPAERLDDRGWTKLLDYCDRSGLTLFVADRMAGVLPHWAQVETGNALLRNSQRLQRLCDLHRRVQTCLRDAGIPFVVLKGLTHAPLSGLDSRWRQQYDIDILTRPEEARRAAKSLTALGFEPFSAMENFPTDHLPVLIRKTGWEFQGDYFDPEIPVSLEVHFQLWDRRESRLAAPGLEAFWQRQVVRLTEAGPLPAFSPADSLGFASLHALKHLLQGSVRPFHVFELASLLQRQSGENALWEAWKGTHGPELRRLENVGFRLARQWFGCTLPDMVEADWREMPEPVRAWFDEFALAPAAPATKTELWLHCALLPHRRDRIAVIRRRLLPSRMPPPVDGVYLDAAKLTWERKALRSLRQARYVAGRVRHHALAAVRLAGSGVRWWLRARVMRT